MYMFKEDKSTGIKRGNIKKYEEQRRRKASNRLKDKKLDNRKVKVHLEIEGEKINEIKD